MNWLLCLVGLCLAINILLGANSSGGARAAAQQVLQGTSLQTASSSTSYIRLRANRLRRPESCRDSLPRRSEELPALVITGRVKEVYLAADLASSNNKTTNANNNNNNNNLNGPAPFAPGDQTNINRALVNIGRVIKGNRQLVGADIIVSGFNGTSSSPCPNYVKANDSLILLLNHEADRKYSIQASNLLAMNLANLDRVNAIANDEPYKRRAPIDDIQCEAHYCPYGRCVANSATGQLSCHCPESCPPSVGPAAPVCGSDNTTYTNECHLIKEGCRRQRPLFVTKEAAC